MDPEAKIRRIVESDKFVAVSARLAEDHDRLIGETTRLAEIPAPPFREAERARAFLGMVQEHGLREVRIDPEGNVTALRRGEGQGLLCVAAHLDTVFPPGTGVRVRSEGTRLYAPGIGDDTRSLAVLLAWMRALDAAGIRTRADVLFVADVGEEGPGDLRGMRYLFEKGEYAGQITAFITVDSPDMERVVTTGVGSKRYRVTFRAPGGHSYGAFGLVNPLYAMADAIGRLSRIEVRSDLRTTFCASLTGGGTSINSIPNEVWTEFDLRSELASELARLEAEFTRIIAASAEAENSVRSVRDGLVTVELSKIGDRPAGQTDSGAVLPQLACAALRAHGFDACFEASSTDANLPMSLGIPAIKIGSGGTGGRAHSLDEWIDVEAENSLRGMRAGLATLLAAAGMI